MKIRAKFSLKEIIIFAGIVCIMLLAAKGMMGDLEHIEDTNGPDDYSLTTITDENIVKMDLGALSPCTIDRNPVLKELTGISSGVRIYSDKFTGVYEVLYSNYVLPSDFVIDLTSFSVKEGNLRMAVVHNDEIVAELKPDTFVDYCLENVTGTVSLRIAGESASYEFYMSEFDYDQFNHK